jgi:hypothetical protein
MKSLMTLLYEVHNKNLSIQVNSKMLNHVILFIIIIIIISRIILLFLYCNWIVTETSYTQGA